MNFAALVKLPVTVAVVALSFIISIVGAMVRLAHDLAFGLGRLGLTSLDTWVGDLGTALVTLVDDLEHVVSDLKKFEASK